MTKTQWLRLILRVFLSIACVLAVGFIFSNSLKPAEQSAAQSSEVVDTVQDIAATIDPDSPIATATGADYDRLHLHIRKIAHFLEFALLGALFCWCCLSYTTKKPFLLIPLGGVITVPILDELLQTFSAGRAAEWQDVLIDIGGGALGICFAIGCVLLGVVIYRKIKENKKLKESSQTAGAAEE